MADSRGKDAVADALTSKLQSKIFHHRDAVVEYVEFKSMAEGIIEEKKKLLEENNEFLNTIDKVIEEKEILQKDHEVLKGLVEQMKEELEMVKDELEEEKHEHAAAKEELARAKEQLAQHNKELKALRKKLQESEATHPQLESPRLGMVTRFSHKRAVLLHGSPGNDSDIHRPKKQRSCPQLLNNPIAGHSTSSDNLEVLRQKLIKGFTQIDGGRYLKIKEMGKLDEKPFQDACAEKLAPKHSGARASELYTLWQELLNSPNWYPFKSVIVDGNQQEEVIDVDDGKLQGLKLAWGEGPYNSVISALVERKEYNTDGTCGVFDLWKYKEGRKATLEDCVDCLFDNVKKLKRFQVTYRYGVEANV
ncbi:unnamed protein product [Alopecurus aequalis]